MREVKTLLDYAPSVNALETWNVALWNQHKVFVSHPFYQSFLWNKISRSSDIWSRSTWTLPHRIRYLVESLVLFPMYPFVIFVDLFRHNDILFLNPEEKKIAQEKGEENILFAFFRERMHQTVSRIIIHHVLEIIFLVSCCLAVVDPNDVAHEVDYYWYDVFFGIFICSYLVDDFVGTWRRGWKNFSSFWHFYRFVVDVILVAGFLTYLLAFKWDSDMTKEDGKMIDDRSTLSGNKAVNVGATIFMVGCTLTLLRPLRWFLLSRSMGTLVVSVIKVIKDATKIFCVFNVVFFAFAIGTYGMFKPFKLNNESKIKLNSSTSPYHMQQTDLTSIKGILSG